MNRQQREKYNFPEYFFFLFKWGHSDVVQFELIHILPCCHGVGEAKSKEGAVFAVVNTQACIIILSLHEIENLRAILKLSHVLCCLGKADSHEEREIKLEDRRGPMKESRVCNDVRLYPRVSFLWSQRPSQISFEVGSIQSSFLPLPNPIQ